MGNVVFDSCGTSIFETMSRLAREVDAVNLGQGFPEGLEPKEVIEAAMRALRDGPHQYPPMLGLPDLRQAVAETARRFLGLEVDWEREVLVTSGATEALADALFGLLNAGDEVILIEPAYDSYPVIVRRAGAIPIPVRLRPPTWELPRDELKRAIGPRTKAIVINTPMNPIGKVFDDDDLRFVADLLIEHDLVAIADEVYEHLVFDGRRHNTLFAQPDVRDRVVRIGSAGKTFSVTGWKVGYVTADAKLLAPIARAHQFVTFTTPPALQAAAAFGLRLPDSYYHGLRTALEARRDVLVDGLRDIGFAVGDVGATYFAVAAASRFDPAGDDAEFCLRLTREAGVAAVPISAFYGERDVRSHIRFCFAKTRETLDEALARLARWSRREGRGSAS
ncbi:aspartate/methionine/tyrosine aminotransferase [Roseiarcus fermentans]|uniref:Aspartate/methionine/tyrosine aminotransferase n=1 Tax=Roseiarcus fermentans TaxID=1473586 RepID=A0A366EP40_9HYPH|nr:aminotransferase [Roseiarcus fermentans]RBP04148.1 aspartate/methionine/tyrosine aminotransferase [Roseiarcus fermentans]